MQQINLVTEQVGLAIEQANIIASDVNIVFVALLCAVGLVGYLLGFGRSLKFSMGGYVGVAISIVLCVLLGGWLSGANASQGFVADVNNYLASLWGFLAHFNLGLLVFYVCLFVALQILRITVVAIICALCNTEVKGVKFASRLMGATFMVGISLKLTSVVVEYLPALDFLAFIV
ncbi:MAG: hypothetical protein FWB72_03655 [Firmicutes bacterium]|nr:hypothetical protein [Bacillota bacterium]